MRYSFFIVNLNIDFFSNLQVSIDHSRSYNYRPHMIGKYFHQKKIKSLHNSVSFAECFAMISKDNRKIVSKTWNINWLFLLTLFKTFNAEELFVCNIHYINYIKESERERERESKEREMFNILCYVNAKLGKYTDWKPL